MIKDLIDRAKDLNLSQMRDRIRGRVLPPTPIAGGIPTLKSGFYRPMTPQLKGRFETLGRWEWATHGHWLGLDDMEALWKAEIDDELLDRIKGLIIEGEDGWPNEAASLFKPQRLSLFAGSDLNYEKMYLLWLEGEDEPEVWVYDANGESRYKDLASYLTAYLNDDVSAAEYHWKLAQIEQFGK